MRILQLIDSLNAGGAERMAVNFVNALENKIAFSGIVATRKEGVLKNEINPLQHYFFLNKKHKFDFKAVYSAVKFIKKHKIEVVHAHGSSYFFGILIKVFYPKIKLIWHDHYGNRAVDNKQMVPLKMASFFFTSILTVNQDLEKWAKKNLNCSDVFFLPNFSDLKNTTTSTILKGENNKRIVCLANLKHPKNHITLVEAFAASKISASGWTLHLIGKDFNDAYSKNIKTVIQDSKLSNSIFIYNSCQDVAFVLSQATIGVLASTFEGFPVTLLEYATAKLAVVSTNVGFCSTLIHANSTGLLFDPMDVTNLTSHLLYLTKNPDICTHFGVQFQKEIALKYSKEAIIDKYLKLIN